MAELRETPAGRLGFHGEQEVKQWLLRQGFAIIANTDNDRHGAPSVELEDGKITLPDFTIARRGKAALVEVKTCIDFTHRDFPPNAGHYQHSVPHSKLMQYIDVEKQTGMPVWLCLFVLRQFKTFNGLYMNLVGTLFAFRNEIGHTYYKEHPYTYDHYFNVDAFQQFVGPHSTLPPGELPISRSIRMRSQKPFSGVQSAPVRSLFDDDNPIEEERVEGTIDDLLDDDLSDIDLLKNGNRP